MRARRRPQAAFTLVEILVALALMAALMTAISGSLHLAFGARTRADEKVAAPRAAMLALDALRQDLRQAVPPGGTLAGTFKGEDSGSSSAAADTLTCYITALDPATGTEGIRKVVFELTSSLSSSSTTSTSSDSSSGQYLVRDLTTNLLATVTKDPTEEVLGRNVVSLNLRYYDGSAWQDSWDSSSHNNALPRAVEATLVLRTTSRDGTTGTYTLVREFALPCADTNSPSSSTSTAATGGG
jgi:prepilin-type N-terminal cleavage/methylation domain-containing protein